MKHLLMLFLLLLCTVCTELTAQTLHTIIYADTKDDAIGRSVLIDSDKMDDEFDRIATATGMKLVRDYNISHDFSKPGLISSLKNLNVSDDDVIFCYISAHGVHAGDDKGYFPQVKLITGAWENKDILSLEAIHTYLRDTYNARLVITMGDMCNSIEPGVKEQTITSVKKVGLPCETKKCFTKTEKASYKKLFRQTKGDILMTSSEKGKNSSGDILIGGYFTHSFVNALKGIVQKSNPSWKSLFVQARKDTYKESSSSYSPVARAKISDNGGSASFSFLTGISSTLSTSPALSSARSISPGSAYLETERYKAIKLKLANRRRKYGYINKSGGTVIPFIYYYAESFSEGLAWVTKRKRGYGFINKSGGTVIPFIYYNVHSFSEGLANAQKEKNGKWGFINKSGGTVIPSIYYKVYPFSEGLAAVKKEENGKWGYINKSGGTVIPFIYDNAISFSEGLAWVLKERDGKWGCINKSGGTVIPFIYARFWPFSEGLATVNKESYGRYFIIDKKGTFVRYAD